MINIGIISGSGPLPFLIGKNLIKRCLNNLIDNSIKYSKNIKISLKKNLFFFIQFSVN